MSARKHCEKCNALIADPQLVASESELCEDCAEDYGATYDDDEPDTDDGPWAGPGARTFSEGGY